MCHWDSSLACSNEVNIDRLRFTQLFRYSSVIVMVILTVKIVYQQLRYQCWWYRCIWGIISKPSCKCINVSSSAVTVVSESDRSVLWDVIIHCLSYWLYTLHVLHNTNIYCDPEVHHWGILCLRVNEGSGNPITYILWLLLVVCFIILWLAGLVFFIKPVKNRSKTLVFDCVYEEYDCIGICFMFVSISQHIIILIFPCFLFVFVI